MTSLKKDSASTSSRMWMTVKFIEHVKKHPCIYDNVVKKKSNPRDIEGIWKKISEDCGLTIDQAKRKWNYLVDTYKSSLRGDQNKKCTFKDELKFLIGYVQEISTEEIQEIGQVIKKEPCGDQDSWSDTSSRKRSRSSLDDSLPSTSTSRQFVRNQWQNSNASVYDDDDDEMTPFFQSMCRSAKKLPRDLQIQVKSTISELINGAERSAMERNSMETNIQ